MRLDLPVYLGGGIRAMVCTRLLVLSANGRRVPRWNEPTSRKPPTTVFRDLSSGEANSSRIAGNLPWLVYTYAKPACCGSSYPEP